MTPGGIEGKWEALNEERTQLREKVKELEAERDSLKATVGEDLVNVVTQRDQLQEQVAELQRGVGAELFKPTDEEAEVFREIVKVFHIISQAWKLRANATELTIAVHTIQSFIIQHMLQRIDGELWGKWYEE